MKCGWVNLRIWRIYLAIVIWTSLIHLCRGFAQISFYWETRQTHSKRTWQFGVALCRKEIQRCFHNFFIFLTSVDVIAKRVIRHCKSAFVGANLRIWLHYFPEYKDPQHETVTALVNKMIVIICCIHCDFMLPVRKNILCCLPVRWRKKVKNHCARRWNSRAYYRSVYKYYTGGDIEIPWILIAYPTLSSSLCKDIRNAKDNRRGGTSSRCLPCRFITAALSHQPLNGHSAAYSLCYAT